MATDNNIKNFTGADIEKYHKGLLSAKERHDLEKAALDDPFLAEALEGYAVPGVHYSNDLDELKKRLAGKVESAKVITMKSGGKASFPWLRVAAMVVIIGGAGLLAQQYLFKEDKKDIAQVEKNKVDEIKPGETSAPGTTTTTGDSGSTKPGIVSLQSTENNQPITTGPGKNPPASKALKDASGKADATTGDVTAIDNIATQPVATAPVKTENEKKGQLKIATGNNEKKDIAREEVKSKPEEKIKQDADGVKDKPDAANEDKQKNRAVAASRKVADDNYYRNQANIFRGRVTDQSNAGVPFANVTNAQDNNAGTYTDARGYFNLTYPDTVLTVQVKSVGFKNTNVQLRNNVDNNQVILRDDNNLSEVVISNKKPNVAARSKEANKTLEEPEPADGWDNYDTYLVNNLKAPEEIKTKPNGAGEVKVSFEVDKNGEPISIKIEKSLCDKCDQEAIRLIKEGPKWKRHAKKGRTTVTISF